VASIKNTESALADGECATVLRVLSFPLPPRPPPPFLADPPLEDLFCSRAIPVNRAGEIKEEEGKKKQISTFLELLLSHNGSCFLLFFLIPPTFPDIYIYIYIYTSFLFFSF